MRTMKDSGNYIIDSIPTNWSISRLKLLSKIKTGGTPSRSNALNFAESGMLWVKPDNLNGNNPIIETKEYLTDCGILGSVVAKKHSTLVCCIGTIGKLGFANKDVTYNQQINSVYFNDKIYWKFGFYSLFANEPQHWFYSNGNVIKILNNQGQGNVKIVYPPLDEQKAIADFLDEKCAEIDSLITDINAQIETLEQYKRSVITEAVTKGLNPDAKMKDSGIEWVGEVPKGWDINPLKYDFNILSGATPLSNVEENWDGDIKWVTPADYKTNDVYVSSGKRNISQKGFLSCSTSLIPSGSLIISKRAPIGTVAITIAELCTNQGCLSCVPKKEKNIKYSYYFLSVASEELNLKGSGTTFKEISLSDFSNLKVLSPPLDEQKAIADFLDEKCTEIDQIITDKKQQLEILADYKKSLIYEYVTGKKEVLL